jgi:hypothetical protein
VDKNALSTASVNSNTNANANAIAVVVKSSKKKRQVEDSKKQDHESALRVAREIVETAQIVEEASQRF